MPYLAMLKNPSKTYWRRMTSKI